MKATDKEAGLNNTNNTWTAVAQRWVDRRRATAESANICRREDWRRCKDPELQHNEDS